jgi:hypothetical protein
LRARFGDKVATPLISADRSLLGRARPGIDVGGVSGLAFGTEFAGEMISAIEARALWARYGL